MAVLIACEFSGVVRRAFLAAGFDAYSCDLLPSPERSPRHIRGDVTPLLQDPWDLIIAHPPCTYLAVSGARWWANRQQEQQDAIAFVLAIAAANSPRIAIENPIGRLSTVWRSPDQIIQPWQFGHGETKATCLWLKGLPKLVSTNVVAGREARIHKMVPSKDRGMLRSLTYQGIADAMATQWGKLL